MPLEPVEPLEPDVLLLVGLPVLPVLVDVDVESVAVVEPVDVEVDVEIEVDVEPVFVVEVEVEVEGVPVLPLVVTVELEVVLVRPVEPDALLVVLALALALVLDECVPLVLELVELEDSFDFFEPLQPTANSTVSAALPIRVVVLVPVMTGSAESRPCLPGTVQSRCRALRCRNRAGVPSPTGKCCTLRNRCCTNDNNSVGFELHRRGRSFRGSALARKAS